MRAIFVVVLLASVALVPGPAAGNHDSSDTYTTIPIGGQTYYIDDELIPIIYREANNHPGLQRGNDGNGDGHLAHGNPDDRIF